MQAEAAQDALRYQTGFGATLLLGWPFELTVHLCRRSIYRSAMATEHRDRRRERIRIGSAARCSASRAEQSSGASVPLIKATIH